MCRTIKNCFDDKLTYIKLYEAHRRASFNKRNKKELLMFEVDLESNLTNLYNSIKKGTYKLGKYREFLIYEPKLRSIKSLPYIDRVVHQWYIEEFIKPYIIPRLVKDTYACIDGRGTHQAAVNMQRYMRIMKRNHGSYYILKCDIKKFFYNINKEILFNIMKKYISDTKLLAFTKILIFDGTGNVGIPIGNYTSQYFANIYLNKLDRYVKDTLRIKYYVRYMDDFVMLVKTKEEAKELKQKINLFVNEELELELNNKSKYYPNSMGADFCGYRIFETHRLLRNSSKKR